MHLGILTMVINDDLIIKEDFKYLLKNFN